MAGGTREGAGRKKGTPNRSTDQLRNRVSAILDNNIEQLQQDISSLDPRDRVKAIIDLLKFSLPTLKSVDATVSKITTQVILPKED